MTYWNGSKSVGKVKKYVYCGNSKKVSVDMDIDLFKRLVNYVDDGPNLNSISHAINVAVEEYVDKLDMKYSKIDKFMYQYAKNIQKFYLKEK